MSRRFLIISFMLFSFVLKCHTQSISDDNQLRETVRQFGQATVKIRETDRKYFDILTRNVSVLSVTDKMIEISLSPLTVEWFIMQSLDYQIANNNDSKGVLTAGDLSQAMEWDTYPTYTQYDSIMRSFETHYPSLCRLDTIGTSINGKLVLALKVSYNAAEDEDEPEVFYSSTIHGDETGGFVLMLRLADYLLKNYNSNSRVKKLLDNLEIWINPLANPDGTYRTGNTIISPVRYNANGVDLNRNFPDPFQPYDIREKENIDMITFMHKHKFVISANFHSGAELINYPWDRWLSKFHADDTWFNIISRSYADTVHYYSGTGYFTDEDNGVTRGAEWYVIYGGRQDYVTYEMQGREVTIELDHQHITPAAQLSLLWNYNWHSLVGYLENALYGIHGYVLNANSLVPVEAKVFIQGYDKDSSHVYSYIQTGSFVRFLAPGTWTLTFSADNYSDLTISNIIVTAGQMTEITVKMNPIINSIDTINPPTPVLYPNPATTELRAVMPDRIAGQVNVKIISYSGVLITEYNTEVIKGEPIHLDIKRLSPGTYAVIFTNLDSRISFRSKFIKVK